MALSNTYSIPQCYSTLFDTHNDNVDPEEEKCMTQLFKCETVAQFKLMEWLISQGVSSEEIANVSLLAPDRLRVTNPAGQYLVVHWTGGHAEIEGPDE